MTKLKSNERVLKPCVCSVCLPVDFPSDEEIKSASGNDDFRCPSHKHSPEAARDCDECWANFKSIMLITKLCS